MLDLDGDYEKLKSKLSKINEPSSSDEKNFITESQKCVDQDLKPKSTISSLIDLDLISITEKHLYPIEFVIKSSMDIYLALDEHLSPTFRPLISIYTLMWGSMALLYFGILIIPAIIISIMCIIIEIHINLRYQ